MSLSELGKVSATPYETGYVQHFGVSVLDA